MMMTMIIAINAFTLSPNLSLDHNVRLDGIVSLTFSKKFDVKFCWIPMGVHYSERGSSRPYHYLVLRIAGFNPGESWPC